METIEKAAIQIGDVVWSVKRPGRHHDVVAHFLRERPMHNTIPTNHVQGFVTSTGRFVGREEACVIASIAGQITEKTQPADQLFSEDVW